MRCTTITPVPTARRDDVQPLGIAGPWDRWRAPTGEMVESFTMLTINAAEPELRRDYHRPGDEKRGGAAGAYGDWLDAGLEESMDFMQPYPADRLVAAPVVDALE